MQGEQKFLLILLWILVLTVPSVQAADSELKSVYMGGGQLRTNFEEGLVEDAIYRDLNQNQETLINLKGTEISNQCGESKFIIKVKPDLAQAISTQANTKLKTRVRNTNLLQNKFNNKFKVRKLKKVYKDHNRLAKASVAKHKFKQVLNLEAKYGFDRVYEFEADSCLPASSILELIKASPEIEYAEQNLELTVNYDDSFASSNGSLWQLEYDELWGLRQTKADLVQQNYDIEGEGVVAAVIDTGVDYNHPDIWDNIWVNPEVVADVNNDGKINLDDLDLNHNKIIEPDEIIDNSIGRDFSNGGESPDPMDRHGHGTHVAGTIAASANNTIGIVGMAPKAKILPVQVLNDYGSGSLSDIAKGVRYVAELKLNNPYIEALVTNNSYGGMGTSQTLADAFAYAKELEVISIVAAGNSSADAANYIPASLDSVISVAATGYNSKLAGFSNYGDVVDIAAPGGGDDNYDRESNILSIANRNSVLYQTYGATRGVIGPNTNEPYTYLRLAGTSMACPHVVGLATLLKSKNSDFDFNDIRNALRASATNFEHEQVLGGAGIINALAAIQIDSPMADIEISNLKPEIKASDIEPLRLVLIPGSHSLSASYHVSLELSHDKINWQELNLSQDSELQYSYAYDASDYEDGVIYFRAHIDDGLGQSLTRVYSSQVNNIEFRTPLNGDFANTKDLLDIEIDVTEEFSDYRLVYSVSGADTWQDLAVLDEELLAGKFKAKLQTSDLIGDQAYQLRLIYRDRAGLEKSSESIGIYLDSKLKSGFPIKLEYQSDSIPLSSNSANTYLLNMDDDPEKEILIWDAVSQKLIARDGAQELWSKAVESSFYSFAGLKVVDYDSDSNSEIIYMEANTSFTGYKILNRFGELVQQIGFADPSLRSHEFILFDLDKDGSADLVDLERGSMDFENKQAVIRVYDIASGELIQTYENMGNARAMTLANLDDDSDLELVLSTGLFLYETLDAINFEDASHVAGWPLTMLNDGVIADNYFNYVSIADINSDGYDEILIRGGDVSFRESTETSRRMRYQNKNLVVLHDGSFLNNAFIDNWGDGVIIDFDNDGQSEFILHKMNGIEVYNNKAELLKSWSIIPGWDNTPFYGVKADNFVTYDLNNDGHKELLMNYGSISKDAVTANDFSLSGGLIAYDLEGNRQALDSAREIMPLPSHLTLRLAEKLFYQGTSGSIFLDDQDANGKTDLLLYRYVQPEAYNFGLDDIPLLKDMKFKPYSAVYAWEFENDFDPKKNDWLGYRSNNNTRDSRIEIDETIVAPEPVSPPAQEEQEETTSPPPPSPPPAPPSPPPAPPSPPPSTPPSPPPAPPSPAPEEPEQPAEPAPEPEQPETSHWDLVDTNKDDEISDQELKQALLSLRADAHKGTEIAGTVWDLNEDGQVDDADKEILMPVLEENENLTTLDDLIDFIDANSDGLIGRNEKQKAKRMMIRARRSYKRKGLIKGKFLVFDLNKDSVVNKADKLILRAWVLAK